MLRTETEKQQVVGWGAMRHVPMWSNTMTDRLSQQLHMATHCIQRTMFSRKHNTMKDTGGEMQRFIDRGED